MKPYITGLNVIQYRNHHQIQSLLTNDPRALIHLKLCMLKRMKMHNSDGKVRRGGRSRPCARDVKTISGYSA